MSFSMSPPGNSAPSPYQQHQQPPPQPPQQQQLQYPNHTYSPYVPQGSPSNASPYQPPPAKRPRLSPDPRSPQAYSNGNYHQPPPQSQPYGNPYAQSPAAQSPYSPNPNMYPSSPVTSFNTPQPHPQQQMQWAPQPPTPAASAQRQNAGSPQPSRQMMPPPPRPNKDEKEERVGVDDIQDAMYGSGVNLKEEEAYMHSLDTSFGSGYGSRGNSFNMLTQSTSFGSAVQNGALAGTMGVTHSQDEVEKEVLRKREEAAKDLAERRQHHLNNAFLLANVLRQRVDKVATHNGVRLDVDGLYIRQPTHVATNADGSEGIVQAGSKIDQQAPFGDVLSLISLAAGERLRGLIDDAHALARARRYGDHGRVPPDFADLAVAPDASRTLPTEDRPEQITTSSWDRPRSSSSTDKPTPTLSFQSSLNTTFASLASSDRAAESSRLAVRTARQKRAEAHASAAEDAPLDAPDVLPDVPKISKKEQIRQQKEAKQSSEAQLSATTNQTAAMMAFGKKAKKYSWMTGASASQPTNRFVKPGSATPGAGAGGSSGGGGSRAGTPGLGSASGRDGTKTPIKTEGGEGGQEEGRRWGEWSERGEGGRGVQVRDWVLVLERDGREREALQRVVNRMG